MIVHRICRREYASDLSGTGSMLFGGRWNSKGKRLIYTSESLSLAALEMAVNMPPGLSKKVFHCIEIEFPDSLEVSIVSKLPKNWNSYPYHPSTVKIGDRFIKEGRFCLKVPSVVVPSEFNLLLNPDHPDFSKVKISDQRHFFYDSRLKL